MTGYLQPVAPPGVDWRSTTLCPKCDGYGYRDVRGANGRPCGQCHGVGSVGYAEPKNVPRLFHSKAISQRKCDAQRRALKKGAESPKQG